MALKRYDEAIDAFTYALDHNPDLHAAWSNRGQAQLQRGNLREAVADLKQANLLHQTADTSQLLDEIQADLANPDAAASFRQALEHFANRQWDNAQAEFEAALQKKDLRIARCHNGIGLCLFMRDETEPALVAFEKATEADPSNSRAWHNRAEALTILVSSTGVVMLNYDDFDTMTDECAHG
jgi:tetratricopeptide (TPR) repeat protein